MIAKLEFDCSIPEEAEKMKRALLADDLCSVISNIEKHLLRRKKNDRTTNGKMGINTTLIKLYSLLEANGINLDEIWS